MQQRELPRFKLGTTRPLEYCAVVTGQGSAHRCRWLRDPACSRLLTGECCYVGVFSKNFQSALIAEEIERTREICAHSLALLRLPIPSTFLGDKLHPPPKTEGDE